MFSLYCIKTVSFAWTVLEYFWNSILSISLFHWFLLKLYICSSSTAQNNTNGHHKWTIKKHRVWFRNSKEKYQLGLLCFKWVFQIQKWYALCKQWCHVALWTAVVGYLKFDTWLSRATKEPKKNHFKEPKHHTLLMMV